MFKAMGFLTTMLSFDEAFLKGWLLQILATVIMVAVLAWLLYNPVLKFLHDRTERIRKQVDGAAASLADAEELKKDYALKLKEIDVERANILDSAYKQALEKESQIISDARKEAEQILQRARLNIAQEQEQAKAEMKKQIIEISSLMATRYVSGTIDENTQNKLIDEVISDLGDVTWLN